MTKLFPTYADEGVFVNQFTRGNDGLQDSSCHINTADLLVEGRLQSTPSVTGGVPAIVCSERFIFLSIYALQVLQVEAQGNSFLVIIHQAQKFSNRKSRSPESKTCPKPQSWDHTHTTPRLVEASASPHATVLTE